MYTSFAYQFSIYLDKTYAIIEILIHTSFKLRIALFFRRKVHEDNLWGKNWHR